MLGECGSSWLSTFSSSFFFGCVGSSFLCEGFLQLRQAGATLHRGAQASRYRGLSCCGAHAPGAQAQWLWLTGLVAPRHVGSSQTRARTCVPCIGRQILNHSATREAPLSCIKPLRKSKSRCLCATFCFQTDEFFVTVVFSLLAGEFLSYSASYTLSQIWIDSNLIK